MYRWAESPLLVIVVDLSCLCIPAVFIVAGMQFRLLLLLLRLLRIKNLLAGFVHHLQI
jgi:hypothetical protein